MKVLVEAWKDCSRISHQMFIWKMKDTGIYTMVLGGLVRRKADTEMPACTV